MNICIISAPKKAIDLSGEFKYQTLITSITVLSKKIYVQNKNLKCNWILNFSNTYCSCTNLKKIEQSKNIEIYIITISSGNSARLTN